MRYFYISVENVLKMYLNYQHNVSNSNVDFMMLMYCVAEMKRACRPANTRPGPKLWCKRSPGPWAAGQNH